MMDNLNESNSQALRRWADFILLAIENETSVGQIHLLL